MNAKGKSVLVIDDDVSILTMVKLFLQNECQVYAVNSAMAAIEFLKKKTADLIFLDYEMPVIKGPKAFKMIRSMEGYEDIPIVFMTGASDRETVMACLQLNPFSYVVKPFTYEQLMEILNKVFGEETEVLKDVRFRHEQIERSIALIEEYEVLEACKLLRQVERYEGANSSRRLHVVAAIEFLEKYDAASALVELRKIGNIF